MSIAARLEIELDRPSRTYHAGETIAGRVKVHVREIVMPERLSIELRWRTHGRGKTAAGKGIKLDLLQGERTAWEGGQTYAFPFRFGAPPWPPTLDGSLVSVVWSLTARGSVGWRRVETAREEIRLEAVAASPREGPPRLSRGNPHAGMQEFLKVGGGFLAVGALITVVSAQGSSGWIVCGLAVGSIGLILLWLAVKNYVAEQRLGPVHAAVSARANPGGEVLLELRFAPPQAIVLNRVTAVLTGTEEAVYDDGETKTTDTSVAHSAEQIVHAGGRLGVREPVAETVRFKLPVNAPFSFEAENNKVHWNVAVHIDVPGWPDWMLTLPFEVLPGRIGAPDLKLGLVSITVQEGQRCPYCHEGLAGVKAADLQTCVGCRAVLHRACLKEYGSCTTRGCRNNRREAQRAQA